MSAFYPEDKREKSDSCNVGYVVLEPRLLNDGICVTRLVYLSLALESKGSVVVNANLPLDQAQALYYSNRISSSNRPVACMNLDFETDYAWVPSPMPASDYLRLIEFVNEQKISEAKNASLGSIESIELEFHTQSNDFINSVNTRPLFFLSVSAFKSLRPTFPWARVGAMVYGYYWGSRAGHWLNRNGTI